MHKYVAIALGILGIVACASPAGASNLILNGSFESPVIPNASPYFITVDGGTAGLTDWTVGLVSIDVVNTANFWFAPAADGAQVVDIDGSPGPGEISQAFATSPGALYTLDFSYANNFGSDAIVANPGVTVSVSNSDLTPFTVNHSTSGVGNLDWVSYSTTFTASSSSSTLDFTSTSPGGVAGVLLDAVSVTAVIPLPAPLWAGLLGLATVAALRRRLASAAGAQV